MFGGKKILHLSFARVSPVFAALGSVLTLAAATPAKTNGETAATVTVRRQAASTQFSRAEEQRAALNSKPTEKRTLADYKLVVTGYHPVALITPRASEVARANAPADSGGKSVSRSGSREIPRVRRIRAAANGDATRVTIDLGDSVQYTSGRIANPERIFFDLHAARLTPEAARANIRVDGGLLTAVRVAQNHDSAVRVVLDVNGVKDYTASLTNNPPQLLIDLYGNSAAAPPLRTAEGKHAQQAGAEGHSNNSATATNGETPTVQNTAAKESAGHTASSSEQPAENTKSAINGPIGGAINGGATSSAGAINGSVAGSNSSAVARNALPGVKNAKSKPVKTNATGAKPDLVRPASAPQPTRDGQSTLTRALALKIGTIVIDACHGGHDTGTIGPTGLMEKDLCLDVALRLGENI